MDFPISICVPSWNSLSYLKILYKSLKKNFKITHELIVHDNGSVDGTEDWLKENNIQYTKSEQNLGFTGVNHAIRQAKSEYILIVNTDMYFLPGADKELCKSIESFKNSNIDRFTLSCCLIEPLGDNPEYNIFYAGHDTNTFNESLLLGTFLKERNRLFKKDNTVQWSHPILIPKFMLEEVGLLDERYFPGWNVDNDLPRSLYEKGCNTFVMLGNARVYHFVSATFRKLPDEIKNKDGQKLFFEKWQETTEQFRDRMNIRKKL